MIRKNRENVEMNFLEQTAAITLGGRNRNEGRRQMTDVADNISNYRRKPLGHFEGMEENCILTL
jgi:hypothetical protein